MSYIRAFKQDIWSEMYPTMLKNRISGTWCNYFNAPYCVNKENWCYALLQRRFAKSFFMTNVFLFWNIVFYYTGVVFMDDRNFTLNVFRPILWSDKFPSHFCRYTELIQLQNILVPNIKMHLTAYLKYCSVICLEIQKD